MNNLIPDKNRPQVIFFKSCLHTQIPTYKESSRYTEEIAELILSSLPPHDIVEWKLFAQNKGNHFLSWRFIIAF